MQGCCADKSCTPQTCMDLPENKTCAQCVHERRCVTLFGAKPENAWCDFFPRRFVERKP